MPFHLKYNRVLFGVLEIKQFSMKRSGRRFRLPDLFMAGVGPAGLPGQNLLWCGALETMSQARISWVVISLLFCTS